VGRVSTPRRLDERGQQVFGRLVSFFDFKHRMRMFYHDFSPATNKKIHCQAGSPHFMRGRSVKYYRKARKKSTRLFGDRRDILGCYELL